MRRYYDRIFPAQLMCRWLSYGSQHDANAGSKLLPHREFSFTTGDDVYIRYLSYDGADALRKVRPKPEAHPKEAPIIVPRREHRDAFVCAGPVEEAAPQD